jgi:hypothetical protein
MRVPLTTRGLIIVFALSLLCSLPVALWLVGGLSAKAAPGRDPLPPPVIEQIRGMSDLATTGVHISDFVEGENDHYFGRWSLHGEVVLGVDLSRARYSGADDRARHVTLVLPQPHLVSSKVDHDRSEELYIRSKVWFPLSDKQVLRAEVWKFADRKIQKLGLELGYAERAKVQAERVLARLYEGAGWKVDFEWQ